MGKPNSTDCLILNVTSGQWERGTFTNGPLGDGVVGVIHMQSHGVFIVHSSGMSLLAPNSKSWVAGPIFSAPAVCSCEISSNNFVTVHMSHMHNVHGYSMTNDKAKPEPIHTWPSLLTKRQGPGCGATPFHFVVAGGVSELDEILVSVEVFDIQSKSLRTGGNLRQARAYFQIVRVGATYCSSQPSMVHWLSSSIFPFLFVRPAMVTSDQISTSTSPRPPNPYIF